MIKAVIIEDEEKGRQYLENLINDIGTQISLVGAADSVSSGLELIKAQKPDVVFLDIQMHSETGFDLLERLPSIDFEIIFTTAYEHYALKAIKFCAIDYLLKPIDTQELRAAIDKVEKRRSKDNLSKNFEVLLQNIKNTNTEHHQIALATNDGLVFVRVNNIIYCESDGPYTTFYLKESDKLVTSKNLKEYEDLLVDHNFFRIHKSYLINMGEIKRYIRGDGGQVIMSNTKALDVSKRKKETFLSLLSKI
jgi:two-component system LytT family response regulator